MSSAPHQQITGAAVISIPINGRSASETSQNCSVIGMKFNVNIGMKLSRSASRRCGKGARSFPDFRSSMALGRFRQINKEMPRGNSENNPNTKNVNSRIPHSDLNIGSVLKAMIRNCGVQ